MSFCRTIKPLLLMLAVLAAVDLFICFDTYEEARQKSVENRPMVRYYDQVRQQRT